VQLDWPASANSGVVGTVLADTKTDATWAAVAPIDLATTGLFLGNGYGGPTTGGTWSGTITLAYDMELTGGPTYATWSGGAPADGDANNDGVKNGVAWVLGAADPDENAVGLIPTLDNTSDPDFFIFNYRRSDTANGDGTTAIKVEYSSDLVNWPDAVAGPDIVITPFNDAYAAGIDRVEVKIRRTLAVGGKLFARLNVVVTP
jgi:hypothetical protein